MWWICCCVSFLQAGEASAPSGFLAPLSGSWLWPTPDCCKADVHTQKSVIAAARRNGAVWRGTNLQPLVEGLSCSELSKLKALELLGGDGLWEFELWKRRQITNRAPSKWSKMTRKVSTFNAVSDFPLKMKW